MYKMGKENVMFGNIEVEKHKFYQHKSPISIADVDISKILVPNKAPFYKKCFKNFIGYKDGKKGRSLWVMLPKRSVYRRDFDKTEYMSFS